MKGLTRFCLILSVVLVLLGCVGIGAGIAMGIEPSQVLWVLRHPGKFASGKLDVIEEKLDAAEEKLDALDDIPFLKDSNFSGSQEYYEFDDIDNLTFDLSLCDLNIRTHKKDHIILEADNVGTTFQVSSDDETLYLDDDRKAPITGQSMKNALRLNLYLPEDDCDDLDIRVGVGNITADCLNAENITIENGVGELKIDALQGENIDLSTGVGDWDIGMISASKSCDINVSTGDITLDEYAGPELNMVCAAGDVSITVAGKENQYNYNLDCSMGNIRLNHHDQESHHKDHHGVGCLIETDNNASRNLYIRCALGSLDLNFKED